MIVYLIIVCSIFQEISCYFFRHFLLNFIIYLINNQPQISTEEKHNILICEVTNVIEDISY